MSDNARLRASTRAATGEPRRLVVLMPNWLGDAVMALPALADLRRALPHTTLAIAARPSVAPLFAMVPGVQETIVLPHGAKERPSARRAHAVEALSRGAFDTAMLFTNSFNTALVAWRAGIGQRWGYRTGFRRPLLTRSIAPPPRTHQSAWYQDLVAAFGFTTGPAVPVLVVPDSARAAAAALLSEAGLPAAAPFFVLAPGAAYGGAKRWPAASFASVAATLAGDGMTPVLIGSEGDRAAIADVERIIDGRARTINLAGRTSLSTLAGVLVAAKGLVSNDSGAMHLASALGVPVVALFGPTNEHATRPLGRDATVLTHDIWCRPCMLRECPLNHGCMLGIKSETVIDAARVALSSTRR
jgi:heptosyltransferase-2